MSRIATLLAGMPRTFRTLRWIKPRQAQAQLHHMLFGIGRPVRLDAAPPHQAVNTRSTPFLPPPAHVRVLRDDRFELLGIRFDFADGADWAMTEEGPLFAYHLHQHEYLRSDVVRPADRARLMLDWIARHRTGTGWDPHPISLRLLCWGKLLTTPGSLPPSGIRYIA